MTDGLKFQSASRPRARVATAAVCAFIAALAAPACASTDDGEPPEPLETISTRDPRGSGLTDLVMGSDGERIGFAVGGSADSVDSSEDAGSEE